MARCPDVIKIHGWNGTKLTSMAAGENLDLSFSDQHCRLTAYVIERVDQWSVILRKKYTSVDRGKCTLPRKKGVDNGKS